MYKIQACLHLNTWLVQKKKKCKRIGVKLHLIAVNHVCVCLQFLLFIYTVRSIINAPPLQNAMIHTTAEQNGTAVVESVLRWCDSRHFAAAARLWLNALNYSNVKSARSKARTVFIRSNTEIVGSNPTGGMDVCVCLFCVYPVWRRVRILPP
jgi:hypothetical protein